MKPVEYGADAACAVEPPHWWFAMPLERDPTTTREDVQQAKREFANAERVCATCPVALACAQYAFGSETRGLWALTESERYYLGGRGFPGGIKASRNRDGHMAALVAVANRFGLHHPVTAWAARLAKPTKRSHKAKVQPEQEDVA